MGKPGAPSTHAADTLASLSEKMHKESDPARKMMFSQLTEALKTGGIGARIPIIQRAVADVNASTARSSQVAGQMLSRSGIGGTPYAAQALQGIRAAGAETAARIPTDTAQEMIRGGPGLITSGSGIPGLSAAASLQQSAANQASQNQAMMYGGFGQAAGAIGGGLAGNTSLFGGGTAASSTVNVPKYN